MGTKRIIVTLTVLITALMLASISYSAEHQTPDPANPTIVMPKVRMDYGATESGLAQSRLLGSLSGAYRSGSQFMGSLEMEQQAGETKYYRGQYFQVFDTGASTLPKVGFSVDYLNNKSEGARSVLEEITALGLIAEVDIPVSFLKFFPQVALLRADVSDRTATGDVSATDLLGRGSLSGYQLASHFSFYLDNKGSYLHYNPQFNDLNQLKTAQHTVNIGTPLRADKKLWGVVRLESIHTKADGLETSGWHNTTNDNRFMIGVNLFL